ncbi:hypothetical protein BB560_003148 [Smittium megazygosporum]|uniref:Uncharacterized protein n=1 Tax=Smittium megazygosporum TaxID=133381 RepID=A0A2T9ZCX0_9FUNG|nr:hypothetical protein BB560_003148 [Smittium megazygosporum]
MSLVLDYSSCSSEGEENSISGLKSEKKRPFPTTEQNNSSNSTKIQINVEIPDYVKSSSRAKITLQNDSISKPNTELPLSEKLSLLLPDPKNKKAKLSQLPRILKGKLNVSNSENALESSSGPGSLYSSSFIAKRSAESNSNSNSKVEKDTKDDNLHDEQNDFNYFFPVDPNSINTCDPEPSENDSIVDTSFYSKYEHVDSVSLTESFPQDLPPANEEIDPNILKYMPKSERNMLKVLDIKQVTQASHLNDEVSNQRNKIKNYVPADLEHNSDFAFEATKQNELKLKESYSQNAKTRKETRSKYVFTFLELCSLLLLFFSLCLHWILGFASSIRLDKGLKV